MKNLLKHVILIPSFQGLVTFTLGFVLYRFHFFKFNDLSLETALIYLIAVFAFSVSTVANFNNYRRITKIYNMDSLFMSYKSNLYIYVVIFFYVVGWYGVYEYIQEYATYFGNVAIYFATFFADPLILRGLGSEMTSSGIHYTYFAWIASAVTMLEIKKKNFSKIFYLPVIITLLLNLLFVDRTRPTWILYTFIMPLYLYSFDRMNIKKILRISFWGLIGISGVFILFKLITGKQSTEGDFGITILPYEMQDLYFYVSGGYAYFNELVIHIDGFNYIPENTFYPIFKGLASWGLVKQPPLQVLEFINIGIPTPTNVGTFLQPYYQDGGIFYVFVGIVTQSFVLDYIGYRLLKEGNTFSIYGWSNLCFTNFIGFFTPKIVTFPIWLILIICGILKIVLLKEKKITLN